jgi:hypothetical protein
MAKQAGNIKIGSRRLGRLVFYKMGNEYYVRTKSSLKGKRVKKDPKFAGTMRSAGRLARASKIGSAVYKALPANFKQFFMYRAFTGEAIKMLKQGMSEEEILQKLMDVYVPKKKTVEVETVVKKEGKKEAANKNNQPYLVVNFNKMIKVGFYSLPKFSKGLIEPKEGPNLNYLMVTSLLYRYSIS